MTTDYDNEMYSASLMPIEMYDVEMAQAIEVSTIGVKQGIAVECASLIFQGLK